MNKLKILMVADYPVGGEKIDGGVQAVSSYIMEGLRRSPKIELSVLSFRLDIDKPQVVYDGDLPVHLLPRSKGGVYTFFHQDFKAFQECVNKIKPDLIHSQGALSEGYVTVKSGYPCVVTFHGIIAEDAKYKSSLKERLRFRLISQIAENHCVKKSPHNILISPYVKRYFGDKLSGDLRYIANPISAKFYQLSRNTHHNRILYAGKIIRRKGIVDLVNALGNLDKSIPFELVLAGALNDQGYVREIREAMEAKGIQDRVHFLGLLDEKQVLDEYAKASILALPSYQETAPMVIQQAMAARVPVLATSICGVPDQLENGAAGLMFEPGDIDTCTRHLATLLTNPETCRQLADKAHEKALRDFHVDRVVEATIDYYESILGKKSQ